MKTIKKLMPIASSLIASRVKDLSGEALGGIVSKLGLPPGSTVAEVENYLVSHPEVHKDAKDIDLTFALKLNELMLKASVGESVGKKRAGRGRDWISSLVACVICAAFLGSIAFILYIAYTGKDFGGGMDILIGNVVGNIMGMIMSQVNFFWGSSMASKKEG